MRNGDWHGYHEGQDGRRLHVYGPSRWHDEAHVVGSRAALEDLKAAIEEALATGADATLAYAADGEGFACTVILLDDDGQWEELELPYHDELARDKRPVEARLTPGLFGGLDSAPEVRLARWRRWTPGTTSDSGTADAGSAALPDAGTAADAE